MNFLSQVPTDTLFAWGLLASSLLAEFIIVFLLTRKNIFGVAFVTLFMNLISGIARFLSFILFIDLFFSYARKARIAQYIARYLTFGALPGIDVLYGILFFVVSVAINTFVETQITLLFFPSTDKRKLLWSLLFVNAISIGLGLVALGIYRYQHTGYLPDLTLLLL